MLRINLLPIRQLKKRAKARNQIIGFGMIFCAVLVALGFVALVQLSKVETVQAALADLQREESRLNPIIQEMNRLEQQKEELERKINVIRTLRRESSLTVRIMDEVAKIIDNDRMWLKSFSQQGGSLQLNGVAMDNQTIAQFMEALTVSEFINGVNLSSSTLQNISGRDFKSFALSCSVGYPKDESQKPVVQK